MSNEYEGGTRQDAAVINNDDSAVSISVVQHVQPGREEDFEKYLRGISGAASVFPGFRDVRVVRPVRPGVPYRIILRFESSHDLQRWVESDERRIWTERVTELGEEPPRVSDITGTAQERPLRLLLTPLEDYVRTSVSGIGLLLLGTAAALIFANSPWSDSYTALWETDFTIGTAGYNITTSLRHWVNDCLMALFFFVLGLEIKREILVGELRYPRQAALPISAAIGGAVVPALVYLLFTFGGDGTRGWGVPIGTDTAFSLGVLSLFAGRVRPVLVVFLTAFAITDDIVAVLVIALFYTANLNLEALAIAGILVLALIFVNLAGYVRWPIYAALGVATWLAVYESGVHGTIAGVVVAFTIPARSWINPSEFLDRGRQLMDEFELTCDISPRMLSNQPQQAVIQALEDLTEQVETPLIHYEHNLYPWVTYLVLPIFAFANAGIPIANGFSSALTSTITWGVFAGLVVGKPLGITLFTWAASRSGIARLPSAINMRQIFAVAWLGGIGFTMSLFITELAFRVDDFATDARIGVIVASILSGIGGYFVLRKTLPPANDEMAANI